MVLHSLRIFRNLFTPHSSPVPLLPHCMQGQEDGIQALAELHNQYHCFGRRLKELNPTSHLERQGFDLETLAPIDKGEMKKRQELAYEELEGEELCGMRLRILHLQNYVLQWMAHTHTCEDTFHTFSNTCVRRWFSSFTALRDESSHEEQRLVVEIYREYRNK